MEWVSISEYCNRTGISRSAAHMRSSTGKVRTKGKGRSRKYLAPRETAEQITKRMERAAIHPAPSNGRSPDLDVAAIERETSEMEASAEVIEPAGGILVLLTHETSEKLIRLGLQALLESR